MSRVSRSMIVKAVILALGLSALACAIPGVSGGETGQGSGAIDVPATSPTATPGSPQASPNVESPGMAGGVCDNAYFPVVEGATWSYSVTGGPDGPIAYTDTISSIEADSFILATTIEDITRTQRWSCRADGLVALDFGGGAATLVVSDTEMVFDTTQTTGVTLPASISPGDTWSQMFTLEGTQSISDDQSAHVTGDVAYDSTASDVEIVAVPAGTFDALRVEGSSEFDLTVEASGFTLPISISGTLVRWYASGVGFVRSVEQTNAFGADVEITTELTSYNIP